MGSKKTGEFDTEGLNELKQKLQKMQAQQSDFMEACAKELAARLLTKVIKRTPVGIYPMSTGKTGGTLRRGWTAGNGDAAGYANAMHVEHAGSEYHIEIINPVEYASYVEYGHRTANHKGWVKGRFMLTISEEELQSIAPSVLEAKLKKYMEGMK